MKPRPKVENEGSTKAPDVLLAVKEASSANQNRQEDSKLSAPFSDYEYKAADTTRSGNTMFGDRYSEPLLKGVMPAFTPTLPDQQVLYLVGGKPIRFESDALAQTIILKVAIPFYSGITLTNTLRVTTAFLTNKMQEEGRKNGKRGDDCIVVGLAAALNVYHQYYEWVDNSLLWTKVRSEDVKQQFFAQFQEKTASKVLASLMSEISGA